MPDDHPSTMLVIDSDAKHDFMSVTDLSDINYGKDYDEDMDDVLNPDKALLDSELSELLGHRH